MAHAKLCVQRKKINERQTKQLAHYSEKLLALMKTVGFLETLGPVACSAAPGPSKSFTEKKSVRKLCKVVSIMSDIVIYK